MTLGSMLRVALLIMAGLAVMDATTTEDTTTNDIFSTTEAINTTEQGKLKMRRLQNGDFNVNLMTRNLNIF